MSWLVGEEPHVQNLTVRRPGYLPIHDLACAGGIVDPERKHTITRTTFVTDKDNKDGPKIETPVTEVLAEGDMFAAARNAVLGLTGLRFLKEPASHQPYLDAIPAHITEAARSCAEIILADNCPLYVVHHDAIRPRR